MQQFTEEALAPSPHSRSRRWLWWLLGSATVFTILVCSGLLGWVMYIGTIGPETSVYTGNAVPRHFVNTMREVGALDPDEEIFYFYSDALTDIRHGFYFVSDKKVVVYSDVVAGEPLTKIGFGDIEDVSITNSDSTWVDSEIVIILNDGRPVSFPVSCEGDKDQMFHDAIIDGMEKSHPPE